MDKQTIKIGILNVMHDKVDTQNRYRKIFAVMPFKVKLTFFYPRMHYLNRKVPEEVAKISQPLDTERVSKLDAFIITGAPIERIPFEDVTYVSEIRCLLHKLDEYHIPQLYFCWGAMIAMNYFYGIGKHNLTEKFFGVYPHCIKQPNQLLTGLKPDFLAPHARYTEMNHEEIATEPDLIVNATTDTGKLFLVTSQKHPERNFVFSHMEYDRDGLLKEYQRETHAYPERAYKKPQNYLILKDGEEQPTFAWQNNQKIFFYNWIKQIIDKNFKNVALAD